MENDNQQTAAPPGRAATTGSAAQARLKAKMDGACAALEGRKLDANQYPEDSELHFEWLAGWTAARMKKLKAHNGQAETRQRASQEI